MLPFADIIDFKSAGPLCRALEHFHELSGQTSYMLISTSCLDTWRLVIKTVIWSFIRLSPVAEKHGGLDSCLLDCIPNSAVVVFSVFQFFGEETKMANSDMSANCIP